MKVADALGEALGHRRYWLTAVLTGAAFALYQLFSTGTIYYDPSPTVLIPQSYPSVFSYRVLDLLGFYVPATAIQLSPQLTIFINPEVVLLLVTESLLVAANSAVALALYDNARCCRTSDGRRKGMIASLTSAIPGLSMLGCCGGVFLSALVGLGAGVGTLQLSDGSPYSMALSLVPLAVMYLNLFWMAPRVTPISITRAV
ncbi:MAG: hypothetical protein KGI38_03790 [Thaumarchaeota archaeon]|nr:hypothetical protein [Nitrososphaerota archaeon]